MCERFARRGDKQKISEAFHVKEVPEFAMPEADYNIAPTFKPIIRESKKTDDREIVLARWGLIPFFTKALSDIKGLSTINVKAETITTARTWREPFKKRRCLVPVSAFYEWDKDCDSKPYTTELTSDGMFAFAGLWDAWKDKHGR